MLFNRRRASCTTPTVRWTKQRSTLSLGTSRLVAIVLVAFTIVQGIQSFEDAEPGNTPECLSKDQLLGAFNRERRASISRPYFSHWRPARDNRRYAAKNSLAFSPRLGKRAADVSPSADIDVFLGTLTDHLKAAHIDVVYEDSTQICWSQPIFGALVQLVVDQDTRGKHPALSRPRLD